MLIHHGTLYGRIDSTGMMSGAVRGSASMTGTVNTGMSDIETYNGEYVIDPDAHSAIILDCADKRMRDNVTVNKIRTATSRNDFGETFYIASEVL